jgi:hypothetical protein
VGRGERDARAREEIEERKRRYKGEVGEVVNVAGM